MNIAKQAIATFGDGFWATATISAMNRARARFGATRGMSISLTRSLGALALLSLAALLPVACSRSDPSQSPQRIAYTLESVSPGRIYVVDASSGQVISLTDPAGNDWSPKWSPNRHDIAFLSDRNGTTSLWVTDAAGTEARSVFSMDQEIVNFEWGPDSKRMALQTVDSDGHSRIQIGDVSNGSVFALTALKDDAELGSWSPDGVWVVYSAHGTGRKGIVRANPNGVNEIVVTDQEATSPTWSPNGSLIAYIKEVDGQRSIFVATPDGENERNLTPEGGDNFSPTWSPDGGRIAFVSDRDGNDEIYVVGVAGSDLDRLTNNRVADISPTWSQHANRIAFVSNIDGDFDLFTMERNGGSQKRVTSNSQDVSSPDW